MNFIQKNIEKLDRFQRRHKPVAFGFGVIKKYGEDEAGNKAALFTYYAFLSLFPLLLILTTLTGYIASSHPQLQADIISSATNYIPVLGNQLSDHVHTLHKSGLALLIGILFTLYGARGVADALRLGIQQIWEVPKSRRVGFPKSILSSFEIIFIGGGGFMLAAISAGVANNVGRGWDYRLLSIAISLIVLFFTFAMLINASLPKKVPLRQIRAGAAAGAIGIVILQTLGGYLLARELKSLDALYSYFALALGLLFWIYLQAQILFYAVVAAAVSSKREWPRSLNGKNPTPADVRADARLKTAS